MEGIRSIQERWYVMLCMNGQRWMCVDGWGRRSVQGPSDLGSQAVHQVEDTGRHPHLAHNLGQQRRRQRGELARLAYHLHKHVPGTHARSHITLTAIRHDDMMDMTR
jgi:hypothetical protein